MGFMDKLEDVAPQAQEGMAKVTPKAEKDVGGDQFAIDVQAVWAQAEPVDGVTTNINVFREELNGVSPSDYFAISEQQLRAATGFVTGAGPLLDGPSVGGEPSRTVDYSAAPAQGQTARLRLVTVIRGGAAYNITLTASPGAFESAASDLDAIIASWSWN